MPVATLSGSRVNYFVMGRDPGGERLPLVLVHGLAASSAFWMPLAQRLDERQRVLMYDLRGHGRSSMPPAGYTPEHLAGDLRDLLDQVGYDRVMLAAHSYGGSVATEFAMRWPQRVAGLILADARIRRLQPAQDVREWPFWERLDKKLESLGIRLSPGDSEIGYQLLTELARLRLRTADDAEGLPAWLAEFFGHGGSRHSATTWLRLLETTTAWQELLTPESFSLAALQAARVPALAVYGENSSVHATLRALRGIWPQMDAHIVPHAGHFFPLTKADELAAHLKTFIEQVATAGASA